MTSSVEYDLMQHAAVIRFTLRLPPRSCRTGWPAARWDSLPLSRLSVSSCASFSHCRPSVRLLATGVLSRLCRCLIPCLTRACGVSQRLQRNVYNAARASVSLPPAASPRLYCAVHDWPVVRVVRCCHNERCQRHLKRATLRSPHSRSKRHERYPAAALGQQLAGRQGQGKGKERRR